MKSQISVKQVGKTSDQYSSDLVRAFPLLYHLEFVGGWIDHGMIQA